jgi:alpha-ribazole phosphatase
MEIYLIRHTRPAVPEGTCYGRTDVPLDEADFTARVPAIAGLLPRGMAFHASPASRCARLAAALATRTGGTLAATDARLHELDFGAWEGRLWRDLPREDTERWTGDIVHYAPPGGETFLAMWERVDGFYQSLLERALGEGVERLAIVGHAGSLKVLLLRTLNLAPARYGSADIAQGRVSRVDVRRADDGQLYERLMFLNR